LEKLAKETEFAAGYVRVKTPHLAKKFMYETSGHLPYYAESMFPAMRLPIENETSVQSRVRTIRKNEDKFSDEMPTQNDEQFEAFIREHLATFKNEHKE